jgi:hypothetical protein
MTPDITLGEQLIHEELEREDLSPSQKALCLRALVVLHGAVSQFVRHLEGDEIDCTLPGNVVAGMEPLIGLEDTRYGRVRPWLCTPAAQRALLDAGLLVMVGAKWSGVGLSGERPDIDVEIELGGATACAAYWRARALGEDIQQSVRSAFEDIAAGLLDHGL